MARIGIVFGLLLCVLAGSALVGSPVKIPILVFPMMVGIPILFCGVVGLNPHRRKLAMFSAASIAAFGLLSGGGRAIFMLTLWSRGQHVNLFALRLVIIMAMICFIFLVVYGLFLWRGRLSNAAIKSAPGIADDENAGS